MSNKELTAKEMQSRGGQRTVEKYGKEFMSEIGSKGGQTTLKKLGKDHFKRIRQIGIEKKKKASSSLESGVLTTE